MIKISEAALKKIRELRVNEQALKIQVIGGGCSGMSYKLSWVDEPETGDNVGLFEDIAIVIDSKSALFIQNMELDYSDGLNGTGFVFNNPNAVRSCGCGQSFST